ncbi:DUF4124 domain-containing protein [Vibrio rumoiensis]|uniref:DUF4124 domain-containing protein n=1 Tax=Vibrio rumoiensis TaxID=76258 RepID=UPI001E38806F|nr:DUF4124 domain-containing protein [Vibrio rumoiensis]
MKRIFISVLLLNLIMGQSVLAGQVYKWTDQKGVTHFSDSPPPAQVNTKEMVSLPDIKAPAPEPQYGDSTQVAKQPTEALLSSTDNSKSNNTPNDTEITKQDDSPKPAKAQKKITLKIANLQDDQTIRSNRGFITVQVELNRKLKIGESLQLMMDTQPYGAPQTPSLWELNNIDRGTHTFSVNVVESGKVIASSNTITVHLHRTTVK